MVMEKVDFAKVCEEVDEMNQGIKVLGSRVDIFIKNKFQIPTVGSRCKQWKINFKNQISNISNDSGF
jgi:hypothetical protein